jgi:hypothetical protein
MESGLSAANGNIVRSGVDYRLGGPIVAKY